MFKATPKTGASDDSDPSLDNDMDPLKGTRPGGSWSKTVQDVITFSKTLEKLLNGSECVRVVRFSEGKWLSLSQITVLARCVNSIGQTYSLFKENRYLFAHLVVETAKLIETDYKAELMLKRKTGKWKDFLPISHSEPRLPIQEVKLEYDRLWVKFNEDVWDLFFMIFCLPNPHVFRSLSQSTTRIAGYTRQNMRGQNALPLRGSKRDTNVKRRKKRLKD
ncbi:hypothetical protein JOM56_007828 [Amanita muscaria]